MSVRAETELSLGTVVKVDNTRCTSMALYAYSRVLQWDACLGF